MFLERQKRTFSDVFYHTHRRHLLRVLRKSGFYFLISGTFSILFVLACLFGKVTWVEAGISVVIFLWITVGICFGLPNSLRVRLLPYFEQRLDSTDTWSRGKYLLEHSRLLDELATSLGATPLSQFASGDDLIPGEKLVWFEAQGAFETTERLLQSEAAKDFPSELNSDLVQLRDALQLASVKRVRFCFLLREGSSASGAEMDSRRGSFF